MASLFIGMRYLIPTNCDGGSSADPIMVFIVLSSLFNAVAYTGGPFPLGYIGLGNISIGYSGLGDLYNKTTTITAIPISVLDTYWILGN
eukprot:scaffold15359_cov79-Skeletonema_marinoi.AAC.1